MTPWLNIHYCIDDVHYDDDENNDDNDTINNDDNNNNVNINSNTNYNNNNNDNSNPTKSDRMKMPDFFLVSHILDCRRVLSAKTYPFFLIHDIGN